jgi:hypothetical protein
MTKYCGVISVGAVAGGGYVSASTHDSFTGQTRAGHSVPVAVELISFRIGETFFRKIRVCQQFVSEFIHPNDTACIYVYKQLGITNVIVAVKSSAFESYSISFRRFLLMIFSQYLFGILFCIIPAFVLIGWISPILATLATLSLPTYGAWTLIQTWKEIKADFG